MVERKFPGRKDPQYFKTITREDGSIVPAIAGGAAAAALEKPVVNATPFSGAVKEVLGVVDLSAERKKRKSPPFAKSPEMLREEERFGESIEALAQKAHHEEKLSRRAFASKFNISYRTAGKWLSKFVPDRRSREEGFQMSLPKKKDNAKSGKKNERTKESIPPLTNFQKELIWKLGRSPKKRMEDLAVRLTDRQIANAWAVSESSVSKLRNKLSVKKTKHHPYVTKEGGERHRKQVKKYLRKNWVSFKERLDKGRETQSKKAEARKNNVLRVNNKTEADYVLRTLWEQFSSYSQISNYIKKNFGFSISRGTVREWLLSSGVIESQKSVENPIVETVIEPQEEKKDKPRVVVVQEPELKPDPQPEPVKPNVKRMVEPAGVSAIFDPFIQPLVSPREAATLSREELEELQYKRFVERQKAMKEAALKKEGVIFESSGKS